MCAIDPQRVVTLDEIGLPEPNPTIEDIFSQEFKSSHNVRNRELLPQAVAEVEKCEGVFDDDTLNSFEKIFSLINKALV